MARALQIFVVLSALFVVAGRCLSGFPSSASAAADTAAGGQASAARPSSGEPVEQNSLAVADSDDDADDGADALITPCAVRVVVLAEGVSSGLDCGALVNEGALPSHAPSLERPPRS